MGDATLAYLFRSVEEKDTGIVSYEETKMKERMNNIMSIVKALEPLGFKDFEDSDETTIEVKTDCPNCRTFVRWEATDYLTVEIIHVFGELDLSQEITFDDIMMILRANYGSYQESVTFLGVIHNPSNNTFYASQSASLIFLPKWSDEDIADVIATVFVRIAMAGLQMPPKPIVPYSLEPSTVNFMAGYPKSTPGESEIPPGEVEVEEKTAFQYFDESTYATHEKDYDLAIRQLDECLCLTPDPTLAVLAWRQLGVNIASKINLYERRRDDEDARHFYADDWVWINRAQTCYSRGAEIFERSEAEVMSKANPNMRETLSDCYRACVEQRESLLNFYGVWLMGQKMENSLSSEEIARAKDEARRKLPVIRCLAE